MLPLYREHGHTLDKRTHARRRVRLDQDLLRRFSVLVVLRVGEWWVKVEDARRAASELQ